LTIANHIAIVDTTYLGSNSSTIRLSDSPYEKRKSGGTENGMSGQEALFLVERKGACLWERWIQSPRPI